VAHSLGLSSIRVGTTSVGTHTTWSSWNTGYCAPKEADPTPPYDPASPRTTQPPPTLDAQGSMLLTASKFSKSDPRALDSLDSYEPLVTFALASGTMSSPAVVPFTSQDVTVHILPILC